MAAPMVLFLCATSDERFSAERSISLVSTIRTLAKKVIVYPSRSELASILQQCVSQNQRTLHPPSVQGNRGKRSANVRFRRNLSERSELPYVAFSKS